MKLGGQLRVASGFSTRIVGWDMNAAFRMGEALGIPSMALAEILPDVECVAVAKMNERIRQDET